MSDENDASHSASLSISATYTDTENLKSAIGENNEHSITKKSITMNGDAHYSNDIVINSENNADDSILPPKIDSSSLLEEVLKNSLANGFSQGIISDQAAVRSDDAQVTSVAESTDESVAPQIVVTEEDGSQQTVVSSADSNVVNTFPDSPVIESETAQVDVVPTSDLNMSSQEPDEPIKSSDIEPADVADNTGNGRGMSLDLAVTNTDMQSSAQASGSEPTSPKSPTKKKSFWSKLAIIFKPWKWKRKKRSKKLEQKAVELERRLSVRKSREELIKRGLLKEPQSDDGQTDRNAAPETADEHIEQHTSTTTVISSTDDENNGQAGKVSFSQTISTDISGANVTAAGSPRMAHQPALVNGSSIQDEEYPPPPDYSEPPPYAPPPPPEEFEDVTSSDEDEEEHILNTIPLVKEVPIREPDLNAVPKKSALKKTVQTRPVVIIRNPQKSRGGGGDTGSYHSSEDSSDEEIHYRDDDSSDAESPDGLASKVARKDSLARFLENRPDEKDLQDRNILHATPEDTINSNRQEKAVKLGRKLSMRPTAEELENRNILHHDQDDARRKADIEDIKIKLNRKLSFRPTIEELKQRNILQFSEYVEVTEAEDYDRRADKPWTRLTPRDKAAIRKELNEFKSAEMPVHDESRHLTRFHRP